MHRRVRGGAPFQQWLEVGGLERRQEAEGAHGERDDGRQRGVRTEERGRVQDGAVSAQGHAEVRDVCKAAQRSASGCSVDAEVKGW